MGSSMTCKANPCCGDPYKCLQEIVAEVRREMKEKKDSKAKRT